MKILIYGAGVTGCTYGWQLSEAGYETDVMVRKGKKQHYLEQGIPIHCCDFREGVKQIKKTVFRPGIIEDLSPENDYDYIIVSTGNRHLKEILPILSHSAGKAHILFFQNMWDDFSEIAEWLSPGQYFFGFPFMAGGGKDSEGVIHSAISGLKYSHTPLGEADGQSTPRLRKMVKALDKAGMRPVLSEQIKVWLITHYAIAAGLSAGISKAVNGKAFAGNPRIIRETIRSIREGLAVCGKKGIDPRSEKANRLYYLPLFLAVPIARKIYANEGLNIMFDGHIRNAPEEIRQMTEDIVSDGEKSGISTPYLRNLQQYLQETSE